MEDQIKDIVKELVAIEVKTMTQLTSDLVHRVENISTQISQVHQYVTVSFESHNTSIKALEAKIRQGNAESQANLVNQSFIHELCDSVQGGLTTPEVILHHSASNESMSITKPHLV